MKHKPDIRFIVRTQPDQFLGIIAVTLEVAVISADGEVSMPGYFYMDDPNYGTNELSHLAVTAQVNASDDTREWYGWKVAFRDPVEIDLRGAKSMASVLTRIDRAMTKQEQAYGRPESFPAYALSVARALGATADSPFGFYEPEGYGRHGYTWLGAEGLRYRLDKA